jgi:CRISPR/Cas system-associated protein Cas10 (large subunit of type III CRISPR-Cas system)
MSMKNEPSEFLCSICKGEFDIHLEGGLQGHIGIVELNLCYMCHSALDTLYTELHGCYEEDEEDDD